MKNNDILKMNLSSDIIFINSVIDKVVCYSTVTTANRVGINYLKTVLDSKRYSSVKNLNTNYKIIGNYSKELINN